MGGVDTKNRRIVDLMTKIIRGLSRGVGMESSGELVGFPLLIKPIDTNYRACTIPYRFPSDNPKKATPTEVSWINLFLNSVPSFTKRAESDSTVADAASRAQKFAQRYHFVFFIYLSHLHPLFV